MKHADSVVTRRIRICQSLLVWWGILFTVLSSITPSSWALQQSIIRRRTESVYSSLLRPTDLQMIANSADESPTPDKTITTTSSSGSSTKATTTTIVRRKRQQRRKPAQRRPPHYWSDPANLHRELALFWTDRGVTLAADALPPIPNEVSLMHYGRHDLRGALSKNGGRAAVSALLGGAPIVPGRWSDALEQSPAFRDMVEQDPMLSSVRPPTVVEYQKGVMVAAEQVDHEDEFARWQHNDSRKPKGYWTLLVIVKELYQYVDDYRDLHQRPAVWMPRPSELGYQGQDHLRQAMNRFGGPHRVCRAAGMVPFREWYYFEGQLELLLELRRFLDEFADGDYTQFPVVNAVKRQPGYSQLASLIPYYGGRNALAARLGMSSHGDLHYGPFDLEFAIRLLCWIRQGELRKYPPVSNPGIFMPSPQSLHPNDPDELRLHQQIMLYGGYENVARRLDLAIPPGGFPKAPS